jgi:chromosome transmission fidelity protein 4
VNGVSERQRPNKVKASLPVKA